MISDRCRRISKDSDVLGRNIFDDRWDELVSCIKENTSRSPDSFEKKEKGKLQGVVL
jgi:hypothetical protein